MGKSYDICIGFVDYEISPYEFNKQLDLLQSKARMAGVWKRGLVIILLAIQDEK